MMQKFGVEEDYVKKGEMGMVSFFGVSSYDISNIPYGKETNGVKTTG
jgi:hypothetical protein